MGTAAWAIQRGSTQPPTCSADWGAATGGVTDSDASRPLTTDVQTLKGMQECGAVDHFYSQAQRRGQPQVFWIDTDSESEPRAQPPATSYRSVNALRNRDFQLFTAGQMNNMLCRAQPHHCFCKC